MKKLLEMMWKQNILRAPEGADGADGGKDNGGSQPDLAAQVASLQAKIAELEKGKAKEADPKPAPKDDPRADALQEAAAKKAREEERTRLQNAIKFNLGIAKYVEENKDFLTAIAGTIVSKVNEKQFSDEEAKSLNMRKNLLEDFFSQQANIDAAPEELKPRIMAFKALAEDEKERQAAKNWDLLQLVVDRKKLTAQVEAAKRARQGGYEETNDLVKDYNAKVFARKSQYLGEGEKK